MDTDLTTLPVAELLAKNTELTAARTAILEEQREIAAELDRRSLELEDRRRAELAELGGSRPPAQSVFGNQKGAK